MTFSSWKILLPRLAFRASAQVAMSAVPRMMTGVKVTKLDPTHAVNVLAATGLSRQPLNRIPNKIADLLVGGSSRTADDFATVTWNALRDGPLAEAQALLAKERSVTDYAYRRSRAFVSAMANKDGHFDTTFTLFPPADLRADSDGEINQHLNDIAMSLPGGGGPAPKNIQETYLTTLNSQGAKSAAKVLQDYVKLRTAAAASYQLPGSGLWVLNSSSVVEFLGNSVVRDGGYNVGVNHALTTALHNLDGWRGWFGGTLPTGERFLAMIGAGQHPESDADRLNSELGVYVFKTAFETACIIQDIRRKLTDRFGPEKAAAGMMDNDVARAIFEELAARKEYGLLVNRALFIAANELAGEVMSLARIAGSPNMTGSVSEPYTSRLLSATPEQILNALVAKAERKGMFPEQAQWPDMFADPPATIEEIGDYLPPAPYEPGGWKPDPDKPYDPPPDAEDPGDIGPFEPLPDPLPPSDPDHWNPVDPDPDDGESPDPPYDPERDHRPEPEGRP